MSSNICGNCANFKPKQDEKFFNCTYAKQAGVSYAMQVRSDTRSCEAFSPLKQPSTLRATTKPAPPPAAKRAQPRGGLCNWGRLILIGAIVIIILILAWGAYSCFSGGGTPATTPAPTPTPTAAPTPTVIHPTPIPTPTPIPLNYYDFGDLVTSPPWQISINQPQRVTKYTAPGPIYPPPGSVFLLVEVTLWNVGDKYFQVQAQSFQLVSEAGAIYGVKSPPISINFHAPFPYYSYTVQPTGSVSGVIIYNPPAAATDLSIRILVNGQYLVWKVPPPP